MIYHNGQFPIQLRSSRRGKRLTLLQRGWTRTTRTGSLPHLTPSPPRFQLHHRPSSRHPLNGSLSFPFPTEMKDTSYLCQEGPVQPSSLDAMDPSSFPYLHTDRDIRPLILSCPIAPLQRIHHTSRTPSISSCHSPDLPSLASQLSTLNSQLWYLHPVFRGLAASLLLHSNLHP